MTVMDGFLFGVGFMSATSCVVVFLFFILLAIEPFMRGD